eukprot:Platyproteum_vivax@DN2358_c0_g1_i1.p1
MIAGCNAQQVRAINALARARIHCQEWPEWQRYDGSIIYDKLPESVTKFFEPKYLDKEGYVDVSNLHIFGKDFLLKWSDTRNVLDHIPCPFDRQPIRQLVACPALSIRLAKGQEFDLSQHKEITLHCTPTLNLDRALQDRALQGFPLHQRLKKIVQGTIQNNEMD